PSSRPTTATMLRAALVAATTRLPLKARASTAASGATSRPVAPRPIPDNRSSARREAEFVRDELARLLKSKAIEKAISPRVISPLSVVHSDPTSLLSRALLHTIAEAQKNLLPPSTRLPLSLSEKESPSRDALSVNAFSDPRLWRSHSLLWCVPPPSMLCQTVAWMRRARAKGVLGLPY
ncbi:hypothetical protein PENTCL1PPCAC_7768, partial [Pristionchus entomophagus]